MAKHHRGSIGGSMNIIHRSDLKPTQQPATKSELLSIARGQLPRQKISDQDKARIEAADRLAARRRARQEQRNG